MKKRLLSYSLMLTWLLTFSCGLSGQQSLPASKETSAVVLEAKPVKTVYAREEAVEFDFVLRNDGTDPVIVPRALRLSLSVELEISNPAGQQPKWCGRIADEVIPSKSRYRSLAPGESLHARLTVSCVDRDQPNRAWGYLLDTPGKYTIKAGYRLPQPKEFFEPLFPKQNVARGPIFAKPVMIEIR